MKQDGDAHVHSAKHCCLCPQRGTEVNTKLMFLAFTKREAVLSNEVKSLWGKKPVLAVHFYVSGKAFHTQKHHCAQGESGQKLDRQRCLGF